MVNNVASWKIKENIVYLVYGKFLQISKFYCNFCFIIHNSPKTIFLNFRSHFIVSKNQFENKCMWQYRGNKNQSIAREI